LWLYIYYSLSYFFPFLHFSYSPLPF
jgi:hypothetical protein